MAGERIKVIKDNNLLQHEIHCVISRVIHFYDS